MTDYIGIDVSRQSLEFWDGTHEDTVAEVSPKKGLNVAKVLGSRSRTDELTE
ncbi:MAG: hypothetical protein ABFD13_05305 [Candidatus Cryosericum sp.]|nr:hypothetical protein [bacterium]